MNTLPKNSNIREHMFNEVLQEQIQNHLGDVDFLPEQYKALFKEISERYDHYEKNEREIKEKVANLNGIMNNSSDSMFSVDREYKVLSANNSFVGKFFNLTGQIVKPGDYLFIKEVGEERTKHWKGYIESALKGESLKIEIKDNRETSVLYLELSFNPIKENGEVVGVGCFSRDITKEKLNAEKLQVSEMRFRSLIENSQDLLTLFNADKKIQYISPAVEDAFGYTNEENSTRDVIEGIHEEDRIVFHDRFQTSMENPGIPVPCTIRRIKKDGTYLWVQGALTNMLNVPGVNAIVSQFHDITERRVATEKLQKSQANLHTILNNADTGYVLVDKDFKVIYFNHHSRKFVEEELHNQIAEGMNALDVFPPERKEAVRNVLHGAFQGNTIDYEVNYVQPDGSERWYYAKYFPVSNDQGVFSVILALTNFTEKKLTAQRIKESNERYELVSKATQDAIWDWNLLTDELYWSDGYEKSFGYKDANQEKNIWTWIQRIHPDDRGKVNTGITAAIENPNTDFWTDEYRFIKENGTIAHIHDSGYIVYNEKKEPVRMVGAMQDITERKKAEEALKKNERKLREISSSIPGIVYQFKLTADGKRSFPYISDGVNALLGISPSDLYKNADYSFERIHQDDRDMFMSTIDQSANTMEPWLYLFRVLVPGNKNYKWIRGNSIPRKLKDGSILWNGTMIEVTEQKLAEIELEKMTSDILRRNKNLEQFSYIVSHNLRAPVANIMGISIALQDLDENADDRLKEELQAGLYSSAVMLDEVITDLNEILQIKHEINERKEEVYFSKLSNDIHLSIKTQLESSNAVIKWDFSEVEKMLTLKSYLQSIFYNLIFNSVKYRRPDVPPVIEIKSHKINNCIELVFKDNCRGIDLQQNGDQVFGLYKRFHNNEIEGKGLGLFMVKTQVEAIGGKISVWSEVNKGTEFKIEFEV